MSGQIPNQLATITKQNGLSIESANAVVSAFAPLYASAVELVAAGKGFEVGDEEDEEGIAKAREMRLKLRKVRCEAENVRKAMKEEGLRFGKALDRVAAVVKELIEPVEAELEVQEQIKLRMEEFRRSELRTAREAALKPYKLDVPVGDLADATDEGFQSLLRMAKEKYEQQLAAEMEGERVRREREAEQAAEQERIRTENSQLKKEAEARETAARAEREKLEAAARAETALRMKAEGELRAQQAAAAAKEKAAADARAKAARAPDKEKLQGFALYLLDLKHHAPVVESGEAKALLQGVLERYQAIGHELEWKAGAL